MRQKKARLAEEEVGYGSLLRTIATNLSLNSQAKRKESEKQNVKTDEGSNDNQNVGSIESNDVLLDGLIKQNGQEQAIEAFNISREECVRRLRAMGQPIRLFAETDKQCKVRLRALELMNEEAGVSLCSDQAMQCVCAQCLKSL